MSNDTNLKPLEHQYKDYSEWMRHRDLSHQRKYWNEEFNDEIPVLNLPLDYVRPREQSFNGDVREILVDSSLGESIRKLAREIDATEYMVFLSAAMVLLSKYSLQEDIVIGSPVSARTHKDIEGMLGMFANTLAMRGAPKGEKRYSDFLQEIKEKCLKAYENQEYPFEELVNSLELTRDISRNPLFDVMLEMRNNEKVNFSLDGTEIEYVEMDDNISKFDLTFTISLVGSGYKLALEYCTDLFCKETMERLNDHYMAILEQIVEDRNKRIDEIEAITEEERKRILEDFNNTYVEYDRNKTVVDLFEEQVEKTPGNIAVVFEGEQITYEGLNRKANQLARKLREMGVGRNDFVALQTQRSIEMIIGIYGILKAGGAYVPIDPEYPEERIRYMLEDFHPKAIVIYGSSIETDLPVVDLSNGEIFIGAAANLEKVNKSDDLAYCTYTSGTTGRPKGVLIEHRGLHNLIVAYTSIYHLSAKDTVLQVANYIFDQSVWDIFNILTVGGRLCLISRDDVRQPLAIETCCNKNNVTIASFTPAMIGELNPDKFPSLRILDSSGEAANAEVLKKWTKNRRVVNTYGPTEMTVNTSSFEYCGENAINIPIGKPAANTKYYVVDRNNNLCGIGVPGELCVSGEGMARGYLNNTKLTAEKFVENPFGEGVMYKTGDLARWLTSGDVECLGRFDDQVKIRGYRIELGEVENAIRKIESIRDCAVVVRSDENREKAISAYIVSAREMKVSEIREELGASLPEYMIPAYMAQIESIPMTRSGKIDRKALPRIERKSEEEYVAPETEEEKVLCKVFCEILGIEKVGKNSNFFELGGDSIKSIRVVSKVREAGYELTVRDIMKKNVVKTISLTMKSAGSNQYDQGEIVGWIKPTPIIRDFGEINYAKANYYNQSTVIRLRKGCRESIKKAFNFIVKHHDVLRSVYRENTLKILGVKESRLYDYYEIEGRGDYTESIKEACTKIQNSIDLENGPLVKVAKISTRKGEYLFVCIHHLVVDGVSWRILTEDIINGIDQAEAGKWIELPQKTASFKEWTESLEEYKKSKKMQTEKSYWEKIIEGIGNGTFKVETTGEKGHGKIKIKFSQQTTEQLLYQSGKAFNTEINDLLLVAMGEAAKETTGQTKLAVMLEGHGREEIHKKIDIDRTVGWFTSEYPVIVESGEDKQTNIITTKEMLRKVPNHGMGYGLIKEEQKEISILFNYMGEMDAERKGDGEEELDVGHNVSEENKLDIPIQFNGEVLNGYLTFYISFDKSKYREQTISKFAESYKKCLESVINVCVMKTSTINTASDWSAGDLDENDYLAILNLTKRELAY